MSALNPKNPTLEDTHRLFGDRQQYDGSLPLQFEIARIFPIYFVGLSSLVFCSSPTAAQLIPDSTLGTESSIVMPLDEMSDRIDGGAIRGSNLFHSFQEFNIDTGRSVVFQNPTTIENILTRVTGSNPSNILGTLGVMGDANLFLINPSGIFFGPNARLDLNGSFLASTADRIHFPDGEFSAVDPDVPPLLIVNVPIGLQFGERPGNLLNQAAAMDSMGNITGLEVLPGRSLVLVGGHLTLEGGGLNAPGGRIELGGLTDSGMVELAVDGNTFNLGFAENAPFGDITLARNGRVSVRSTDAGDIVFHGNRIMATEGGRAVAGTEGTGNSGNITIFANELHLSGGNGQVSSGLYNEVLPSASGHAGDIRVNARSVFVTDGAAIVSRTLSPEGGNAGNIALDITESVSIEGVGSNEVSSGIVSGVASHAVGNSGGIEVRANSLALADGARLNTSTLGQGNAGSIALDIAGPISVEGGGSNGVSSGIFSGVGQEAVGDGGRIEITANSLSVANGALLNTSTLGRGNAGNITIDTTGAVSVEGGGSDGVDSRIVSGVASGAVGDGGQIEITTNSLSLTNGALVVTDTLGVGDAGNVVVNVTQTVFLTLGSGLSARSNGQGRSGRAIANAAEGIVTDSSSGLIRRDSTIFAALQTSGSLLDPTNFIVPYQTPIDATQLIGTDFCSQSQNSQFIMTGRGGIPPSPLESLGGRSPIEIEWVEFPEDEALARGTSKPMSNSVSDHRILDRHLPEIEAQGWVVGENGEVILTAEPYRGEPFPSAFLPLACRNFRSTVRSSTHS